MSLEGLKTLTRKSGGELPLLLFLLPAVYLALPGGCGWQLLPALLWLLLLLLLRLRLLLLQLLHRPFSIPPLLL